MIFFPKGLKGVCADTRREILDRYQEDHLNRHTESFNFSDSFAYTPADEDELFVIMRLRGDNVRRQP